MGIRKSLITIASGALLTIISLLMLAVAFRPLFTLVVFLAFTTGLILALSLLAMIPEIAQTLWEHTSRSIRVQLMKLRNRRRIEKLIREAES